MTEIADYVQRVREQLIEHHGYPPALVPSDGTLEQHLKLAGGAVDRAVATIKQAYPFGLAAVDDRPS